MFRHETSRFLLASNLSPPCGQSVKRLLVFSFPQHKPVSSTQTFYILQTNHRLRVRNEESSWWLKKTYKSVTLKVVLLKNNISNEQIFLSYKIPWAQQPAGVNNKHDATFRELIHLLVFFWSLKISSISQPVNSAWWKPRLCAMTLSGN